MLSVALRLQVTKDAIPNFLKQIRSIHLFYTTYNFSEYFWFFFSTKSCTSLGFFWEKSWEKKRSFSFKVCLGGLFVFLRKKILICLKLCKPGLNQSSSVKLATTLDNTVVRKKNHRILSTLVLFF